MSTRGKKNDSRLIQERMKQYQARKSVHDSHQEKLKRDNIIGVVALLVVLVVTVSLQLVLANQSNSPEPTATTTTPTTSAPTGTPPSPELAENRKWRGELTLSGVSLGVEIFGDLAPQASSSTISLADSGFYNNTVCHRMTSYPSMSVLQCGDPKGADDSTAGTGGPDYRYGPIENAPISGLYPEGTLAMARVGQNGSSMGSQFFIVLSESQIPNDSAGGYTIFGKVTSGLDKLKSELISKGIVGDALDGRPKAEIKITKFQLK